MSNLCVIEWRSSGSLRRARTGCDAARRGGGLLLVLRRVERLRALAAVAIDRHRLRADAPRVDVGLLDLLDRRVLRHVDGLGDRAREERLHRAHHLDVAHVVDRAHAARRLERAVEHRQVLVLEVRRPFDGLVLVDVLDDLLDLLRACSRASSSAIGTVWLTIFISPPPTSFLYFTSAMSGSTPVVSQSIMKPMVPVGASTVACALRKPCCSPSSMHLVPHVLAPPRSRSFGTCVLSMSLSAARCLRITRSIGSRFFS